MTGRAPVGRRLAPFVPVGVLVLLVLVAATAVAGYVRTYGLLSPIDELQHIDYVDRATDLGIVRAGDMFLEPAMREQACRGLDSDHQALNPDCDDELVAEDFQEGGYNTAYIHPPTYYYTTATIGRVIDAAPNVESWVTAARLVGVLWLGLAVALTWFLFAALAIPWPARVPLLLVMTFVPVTLHASATVNPDATALAAGAGVLLAVVSWERGRLHWLWPALAAGGAVALKSTNGIAVLVALGYLGVRALQARRAERLAHDPGDPAAGGDPGATGEATIATAAPAAVTTDVAAHRLRSGRELGVAVGAIVLAVVIVSLAWVGWARAIQRVEPSETIPMAMRFSVDQIEYDDVRDNLTAGFTAIKGGHLPPFLEESRTIRTLHDWADVLVGAGAVVGVVYAAAGSRRRAVAIAAVVACLLTGPGFVLANYVFAGTYVDIPPRYALAALPALLAGASVALERRAFLIGAYAFAGWMAFSTFLQMIRA